MSTLEMEMEGSAQQSVASMVLRVHLRSAVEYVSSGGSLLNSGWLRLGLAGPRGEYAKPRKRGFQ